MTTRDLAARPREHLLLAEPHKSAIKNYIRTCATCRDEKHTVNSLQISKRCELEHESKIQEALLIRKLNPRLNLQLYGKGASFFT